MTRATFIGAPQIFNLQAACAILVAAYGPTLYLVGSSLARRDFRDVDIRCLLDDADFARRFGPDTRPSHYNPRLAVENAALSEWLAARTRLPIDFQFQPLTEANAKYPGPRSALGVFWQRTVADPELRGDA